MVSSLLITSPMMLFPERSLTEVLEKNFNISFEGTQLNPEQKEVWSRDIWFHIPDMPFADCGQMIFSLRLNFCLWTMTVTGSAWQDWPASKWEGVNCPVSIFLHSVASVSFLRAKLGGTGLAKKFFWVFPYDGKKNLNEFLANPIENICLLSFQWEKFTEFGRVSVADKIHVYIFGMHRAMWIGW